MFCIQCGASNSDEAAFCQKCGKRFEIAGQDGSTLLSPLPYVNSPYSTYGSSEPIYPPPPPGKLYESSSAAFEQHPPQSHSNIKYLIAIGVLVIMLLGAGVFELGQLVKGNPQTNSGTTQQGTVPITHNTATTITTPTPTQIPGTLVVVQALSDWQNSGVYVPHLTLVTITYVSGRWNPWPGANFDGNGCTQGCDPVTANVIVGCDHGGLIGQIGSGPMICILDHIAVTASESGMLYLRINDKAISDDSGAITVRITLG